MTQVHNAIAGRSAERLAALSDGVFAVAMTLLVLDLKVPATEAVHSDRELTAALTDIAPRLAIYLLSFMTLGIFWIGQQTQLNHVKHTDRHFTWIHLLLLSSISLLPSTTSLMAEYMQYRAAMLVYWSNIFAFGMILLWAWFYARSAVLLRPDVIDEIDRALLRRILVARALYAVGAALCLFNTYCSIAFILGVQIKHAAAPRIGILARI